MNSSIYFEMRSYLDSKKTYKILMFRKGKLNIPGIVTLYRLSEVQNVVDRLLTFYVDLTRVDQKPGIVMDKLTMCNYVSRLNIAESERLNLSQIGSIVASSSTV